jgi:hypothetical protein
MYFQNQREMKSFIENALNPDENEKLKRHISAMFMILDNIGSYRIFSDLIKSMPTAVDSNKLRSAADEIKSKIAINEQYIKDVIGFIIKAEGGTIKTAEIKTDYQPEPRKSEPSVANEQNTVYSGANTTYTPVNNQPVPKKKNNSSWLGFVIAIIICLIFGFALGAAEETERQQNTVTYTVPSLSIPTAARVSEPREEAVTAPNVTTSPAVSYSPYYDPNKGYVNPYGAPNQQVAIPEVYYTPDFDNYGFDDYASPYEDPYKDCPYCGGDGKNTCGACYGSGYIYGIDHKKIECSTCYGEGENICLPCGGGGKVAN